VGANVNIHTALARIPVSLVLVAALAAAIWPGASEARTPPNYCAKTVRIVPVDGGQPRDTVVRQGRNDFTPAERKAQEADDLTRYDGYGYTPIGPASQFIDCAGNTLKNLFGPGPFVMGAHIFFDNIVLPFGTVVWPNAARKNDIVVFQRFEDGKVVAKHITHIVEVKGGNIIIETKDGTQSTFRVKLPTDPTDPLIMAHGQPSIYRVDPSRIKVEVVDDGPCDPITVVYAPPKGEDSTDPRPPRGGGPGSSTGDAPQGGGTPPGQGGIRTGGQGTRPPQPPAPPRPPGAAGNNPGGPPSSTPPAPPTNVAGLPPKPGAPGAPSTSGSPPYKTHMLSQPFTPGGQCPKAVSNPAVGPTQTAFESCQWDDPAQGGRNGWVGCVTERDMNFVCTSSNRPPNCKCTQDWSGKVPGQEQLVALAPAEPRGTAATPQTMRSVVTPAESQMAGLGPPPEPSDNSRTGGLGPPPEPQKQTPPDNTPMGGLGPPPDPQKHNPPAPAGGGGAAPQGSAAATPQGPIFIPVPVAPPNVSNRPPPNVCHTKTPPNDGHQKPPGSGTNSGTNPGTRIGDTWDTQPKPGDTKPQPAGTAVMNSGTCHLDQSTGIRTCKDTQGRTCTTKTSFCNPAQTAQAAPPPPSGPLKLKQQPGTQQLAKLDEPKTPTAPAASIPACESKAPYLPWGGQGTASITVSGGKPCGVGWHDTGATILENITVSSRPAHGTVTPKNKNEVIFTPTPGYTGQDSFMLRMQERNGGRRATLTVRVTVTIR
jgi:hypothetical protein